MLNTFKFELEGVSLLSWIRNKFNLGILFSIFSNCCSSYSILVDILTKLFSLVYFFLVQKFAMHLRRHYRTYKVHIFWLNIKWGVELVMSVCPYEHLDLPLHFRPNQSFKTEFQEKFNIGLFIVGKHNNFWKFGCDGITKIEVIIIKLNYYYYEIIYQGAPCKVCNTKYT